MRIDGQNNINKVFNFYIPFHFPPYLQRYLVEVTPCVDFKIFDLLKYIFWRYNVYKFYVILPNNMHLSTERKKISNISIV